jgi:hypothetical protein
MFYSKSIKLVSTIIVIILTTSCTTKNLNKSDCTDRENLEKNAVNSEYQEIIQIKEDQKHTDTLDSFKQKVIDRGRGVRGPDSLSHF